MRVVKKRKTESSKVMGTSIDSYGILMIQLRMGIVVGG